jgi:predicted nucleic acid-binding protein
MAIFLLDTTVIIDAINRRRGRDQLLDGLLEQGNLLSCCCINVTEVYAGMRPNELKATEALLRSLDFYEVTWDIARRAGELKSEWAERGHTIAVPDVTIAAVALEHGLTLVTDNRKHFPMPELKVLHLTEA